MATNSVISIKADTKQLESSLSAIKAEYNKVYQQILATNSELTASQARLTTATQGYQAKTSGLRQEILKLEAAKKNASETNLFSKADEERLKALRKELQEVSKEAKAVTMPERIGIASTKGSLSAQKDYYKQLQQQERDLMGQHKALAGENSKLGLSFETLNRSLGGLIGTYLSFSFMRDMGDQVLQTNLKMDSLSRSMEGITGSSAIARREMDLVRSTAKALGTPLIESADGFKQLLAAGNAVGIPLKNIEATFVAMSKASAVYGMSQDDNARAFRALAQMMAKGQVMAEELKGQLAEAFPAAIGIAAKALGFLTKDGLADTQKLFGELEKGAVSSQKFFSVFAGAVEDAVGKAVPNATARAQFAINNMKTATVELYERIGKAGFLDAMTSTAQAITVLFDSIDIEKLQMAGQVITLSVQALVAYGVAAGAAALWNSKLALSFASMSMQIKTAGTAGEALAISLKTVGGVLLRMAPTAGIMALTEVFFNWESITKGALANLDEIARKGTIEQRARKLIELQKEYEDKQKTTFLGRQIIPAADIAATRRGMEKAGESLRIGLQQGFEDSSAYKESLQTYIKDLRAYLLKDGLPIFNEFIQKAEEKLKTAPSIKDMKMPKFTPKQADVDKIGETYKSLSLKIQAYAANAIADIDPFEKVRVEKEKLLEEVKTAEKAANEKKLGETAKYAELRRQINEASAAQELKLEREKAEKTIAIREQYNLGSLSEMWANKQAAILKDLSTTKVNITKEETEKIIAYEKEQYETSYYNNKQREKDIKSWSEAVELYAKRQAGAYQTWGERAYDTVVGVAKTAETAFTDFLDATSERFLKFGSLVQSILSEVYKQILKMYVVAPITQGIMGGIGNLLTPTAPAMNSAGQIGGADTQSLLQSGYTRTAANGGAFVSPSLSQYSSQIVSKPTYFAFAKGGALGLMGEAGAEAIMPLGRTPTGELGVKTMGSSAPTDMKIEIINQSGTPMEVSSQGTKFDFEKNVLQIVIAGAKSNKMGMNDILATALRM